MNTINLTGSYGGTIPRNHHLESFLRPHSEGEANYLDAQVLPKTAVNVGDEIFFKTTRTGEAIIQKVIQVAERRPAKGDWSRAGVHMDWVRLQISS